MSTTHPHIYTPACKTSTLLFLANQFSYMLHFCRRWLLCVSRVFKLCSIHPSIPSIDGIFVSHQLPYYLLLLVNVQRYLAQIIVTDYFWLGRCLMCMCVFVCVRVASTVCWAHILIGVRQMLLCPNIRLLVLFDIVWQPHYHYIARNITRNAVRNTTVNARQERPPAVPVATN